MIPTSFEESNAVLEKPKGMSEDLCEALSVFVGASSDGVPVVVSCWKLTKDEVDTLIRTGRVWMVIVGHSMQPAFLTAESPFQK